MSNCCCCQVINPPAENCNPVTAAQIADLALIEGKDINNCDRYMTLDNLIDPCRLGAQVPAGVITDFVGLDMNDCLVAQSIPAVVVQGETPLTVVDTFSIDFTASGVNGHTLTGSVILSPDPGNILETRNNGMFVGETPLTVVDTASVNLGTSGLYNHTLQADVQISALPGNIISIQADGLFAPSETLLQIVDTPSVDLTVTGALDHTLQADVKISTAAGNAIVVNGDGLFVQTVIETPLVATDSSTVNFTTSGMNNHDLTADVKVSALGGNILTVQADGLMVQGYVSGDTPSINMSIAGTNIFGDVKISALGGNLVSIQADGLFVPSYQSGDTPSFDMSIAGTTIFGNVKLSANAGNILSIQADGLYAAAAVETPLTATDSATVDFTTSGTSGHTLTGSVKLSATGGNQLVANADGLYVPTETTLTVADTSSVNLTAGGVRGHAVQADVKVSATAGNVLVINGDGLYVPTDPTFTATDTATINFTTSGTRGHTLTGSVKLSATAGNTLIANADGLYVPTVTETVLTANDSSSINFTTSGTSNHTLTGVVKLSATAGNSVVINADGIYVPTVTQTALTANDSSTVNFTTSGTDNHTLTADVKVSATAGNEIIVNADGLYVATPVFVETNLTGVDTATVDLQTSGTAQHTLQANVKISASANNQVVAHGDGLFVGVTAQTPITVTDTPSVDLTASGTDNHTIKADVKLSATTCNAIVENADGLFVMDTFSMTLTSAPLPGAGTYNAATIAGWGLGTRSLGTGTITWTNPYCRPARVLAWLRVPNTTMQMGPGNYWISGVGPSGGANLSNVSAHSFGESVQMSWGASHVFLSQTTVPVGGTFNLTVEREVEILAFVNSGFEAITLGSSGVLLMIVPD